MADEILDTIKDALECPIDFEGQRLAEQLTTNILAVVGLFSFLVGYFAQNIHYTLWSGLAGTVITFLIIVPPWPFFNKNPVTWLPSRALISALSTNMKS